MEQVTYKRTGDHRILINLTDLLKTTFYNLTDYQEVILLIFDTKGNQLLFSTIEKEGYNTLVVIDDETIGALFSKVLKANLENGILKYQVKLISVDVEFEDGTMDIPSDEGILGTLTASKL